MFFILTFLIYGVGRAIGWMALSLTMGRDVLLEEEPASRQILSYVWMAASILLAVIICFYQTNWGLGLPL